MDSKKITFLIILTFVIVIPTVNAQEISIAEKAVQKSVQVMINSAEGIHVKHVISSSNSPKQIELINGIISNLKISDGEGKEKQFGVIGNDDGVIIFPSQEDTVVEYDLRDVLFLKDNVWTWDFRYTETTSFIIPQEVDLIFVNDRPVYLDEKKGITCHGCQMILEYSIDEPKTLKNVKWNDKEFLVEIRTFAEINQFSFDQLTKSINFEINEKNQFVTTIIPLELLTEPYNVFMGDQKIYFHEYINNGTHVWLNMRPDNSGKLSIIGTTAVEISDGNRDNNVHILLAIIASIGFIVTMIIMRKKKRSINSRIN